MAPGAKKRMPAGTIIQEQPHSMPPGLLDQIAADAELDDGDVPVAVSHEGLIKDAEELRTLKDELDQKEAEVKQLKDRYDQLRKVIIPDKMRNLGLVKSNGKGSFTFGGGRIHLESKLYASCSEANRPTLFSFLRSEDAADIIKETVNTQTLSAYVRERRGDGLQDPPGVSVHEEVVAKLTK